MAEATKNDKKTFQSLAEHMIDNQIQLQSKWPDLDGILSISCIFETTNLSISTIQSVCKIRSSTSTLLFVQKVQSAKGMTTDLPSFIYITKACSILNFDIYLSWDHAVFILLYVIYLLAIIFIYRKFKLKQISKHV